MNIASVVSRALTAGLLVYCARADAGLHTPDSQGYVGMITGANPSTHGVFGPARNSPGSTQSIVCVRYGDTTGENILCSATDANGAQLSCLTNASNVVDAAKGLSSNSFLAFTT